MGYYQHSKDESSRLMELPESRKERLALIESMLTINGGYTKKSLNSLGVAWPPPKGWKEQLVKYGKLTK
jgi:hypothetical protein